MSIRPRMRVLFTQSLQHTSPATLPLLAWQFVIIQMVDGTRVVDPVLAFARESNIFFYQVILFKIILKFMKIAIKRAKLLQIIKNYKKKGRV